MSLDRGKNAADQMDGFVKTPPPSTKNDRGEKVKLGICAGCKEVIATNGTSILALKKHWHMWCLKCVGCSRVLSEEFVNNEGAPFCMSCYNQSHGTLCSGCQQYIRGRGLQVRRRGL
jgi:actin-binding LIM protein